MQTRVAAIEVRSEGLMEVDIGTVGTDEELKQKSDLRLTMKAIPIIDTRSVAGGGNNSE